MRTPLPANVQAQLFTEARSHHAWKPIAIEPSQLHELYELMKWGPTSANSCPARFVFVTTDEAKQKLYPALTGINVDQARAARNVSRMVRQKTTKK